ncbi:hypothetical protein RO3G_06034 [Rhizopus delemar RA 99-880]|uniref:Uncharacterized protein n=1 Tax=Rhizopus delemar (strain RA 99-880 / ATCC MYA-4621 / FGSC 9543 / NRRL 43880) TaxID=246409 RepID=I1BYP9_RHIO9|nr:hypothetical protein RO3G_06034 [Rhizopus delemar RA 99-880]|eukprot:EIE81329.1 hypothetical protein RO3G_06034 [Rhizopus delemar RA 99-880]
MRICSELAFKQEVNWANDILLTGTLYPTLGDHVHNTGCILNSVTIPSSSFQYENDQTIYQTLLDRVPDQSDKKIEHCTRT